MSFTEFTKSPDAVLDYNFDWSNWLPTGSTIDSSSWSAETGLTIDSSSYTSTGTTVILSSGSIGEKYNVSNTIQTTTGLTETRTFTVTVILR